MTADARAHGRPAPLRRPPSLRPGERVALVSPSSHQGRTPQDFVPRAVELLASWGLAVDPPPAARGAEPRHLYLAGTDRQRAAAFQEAYCDPAVRALFVTRGGYGAARLLRLLDARRIAAAPPKPVVGFSDATALFAYLHAVAGTGAVHGPALAASGALTAPARAQSQAALRRVLFEPDYRPAFAVDYLGGAPAGPVRGPVVGGCLSVVVTTLGTPWVLPTEGAILFLEDTDEAPYRIDRMLTHLRAAGRLEGLRAVVFGYLQRCEGEPPGLLWEMLRDFFRDDPFPVFRGMPAGHGDPNLAFPLGTEAALHPAGDGGAELAFL